jgi:aryl carrier-like protein
MQMIKSTNLLALNDENLIKLSLDVIRLVPNLN